MKDVIRLETLFTAKDRYAIPTYQRGYSWETEHVSELLEDLEYTHDDDNEIYQHFFGTILVIDPRNPSENQIKIIDGQQRLTTILLLLICARNFFHAHKGKPEAQKYCERLEEYIHKVGKPVLTLSRTNRKFFEEIVKEMNINKPLPRSYSESNDSNELLTNAYKIIQSWIKKHEQANGDESVKAIYGLVRTLFEKFVVYKYEHGDEAQAYAVFNLVNNRGTGLNESDLIKNFLFGKLADEGLNNDDLDGYDERWDEIRRSVTGKRHADYPLDRFFYHYLLSSHGSKISKSQNNKNNNVIRLKQKKIEDAFRKLIDNEKIKPNEVIKDMVEWSSILDQLRNPSKTTFPNRDNIIHYLEKIKDVKAVFVYPAILAGYEKYWLKKEYAEFKALVMMCFKYHIRMKVVGTSVSVSTYESIMYDIANDVNCGKTMKEIITNLRRNEEIYPGKDRVIDNLKELRVSNAKLATALLEEAEYTLNEKRSPSDVSVEHIMPKSFGPWKSYIEEHKPENMTAAEFHDQYVSLLGNQTLLSRKKNITASNRPFKEKQKEYGEDMTFEITKRLADESIVVWDANSIKVRQGELAEMIYKAIDLKRIEDELR